MRATGPLRWSLLIALLIFGLLLAACSGDDDDDQDGSEGADDDSGDDDCGDDDTGDDDEGGPYYDPSWAVPTDVLAPVRRYRIVRGIIHAHSIYSHDACDGRPEGNTDCLMQLREALCTTCQDYMMLTDHDDSFAEHEYPDVLLYLPEEGDTLLYEGDLPIANRIRCPDGSLVTLMAGTENTIMPLHLHRHAEGTIEDRYELYGRSDPAVADELRALGASVFINHDEGWSIEELVEFAPDGIEVFNLHAAIDPNLRPNLGLEGLDFLGDLLIFLLDPAKPHPNLAMMTFWPQTEAWTDRWNALLEVQRCPAILATDVHRNALPFPLSDGERADGYRRMMQFFSNHILVTNERPGTIEEAVDRGRMYGAFEYLGMPVGFDFHADDQTTIHEMGDETEFREGIVLRVVRPEAYFLDPEGPHPQILLRLIRIDEQGPALVAESEADIAFAVDAPGAYRAEVHIIPYHLIPFLGSYPERYIHQYPWIYANPIYILPEQEDPR